MTAAHCVGNTKDLAVGVKIESVMVTEVDSNLDLALLSTDSTKLGNIRSYFTSVDPTSSVYLSNNEGRMIPVFALRNIEKTAYFYTAETRQGDSGSGVYQGGKLVGIHVGLGDPDKFDMRVGLFMNPLSVQNHSSLLAMQYERQQAPVVGVAAVALWCQANITLCGGAITGAALTVKFGFDMVLEYWKAKLAQDKDSGQFKDALQQCEQDKELIIREIGSKVQGAVGGRDSSSTQLGAAQFNPGVEILNLENAPPTRYSTVIEFFGPVRCSEFGQGKITCYKTFSSEFDLENSTAKFLILSQIAAIHALYLEAGRWPTQSEVREMSKQLAGGQSLVGAAKKAVYLLRQRCSRENPCSGDGTPP